MAAMANDYNWGMTLSLLLRLICHRVRLINAAICSLFVAEFFFVIALVYRLHS